MRLRRAPVLALALALDLALVLAGCASPDALVLGTTTTTQDSGFLDAILPAFTEATSIEVTAVVGGTGEMIEKAKRGDVDVLLSHDPRRETALVAEGDAQERRPVMRNRFVLVGPLDDPANASGAASVVDAFRRIESSRASFASRGDASGTHARERAIWALAGFDASLLDPAWYDEAGSGQASTLLFANERGAYAITDEATWAQLRANARVARLNVVLALDEPLLRNEYAVLVVNGTRHPGARAEGASAFAEWITGAEGQRAVAQFRVAGAQVFFPEAQP